MQILSCSGALGTCCTDHGLVLIIDIVRKVMSLMQIAVPIILVIWATVELIQLVMNPEEKNGVKKLINKFIAAAVVFLLPVFINITMGLIGDNFSITSCWNQAKSKAELARQTSKYINPNGDEKTTSILPKPDDYDLGVKTSTSNISTGNLGIREDGKVYGADVAAYALKFVGQPFKWGGRWNGELPYTPTTCIGFIEGVYKHFGIKVDWTEDTSKYLKNPKKYTVVTNSEKHPGDIVVYDGHYAMLTGNGNEMVHAMGVKYGIRTSKNYRKCVKRLLGVVRVNGVM